MMSSLRTLAQKKIQHIAEYLESLDLAIDLEPGVEELLITNRNRQHFLLNYHGVTEQIWYSSALSGAHHFAYRDGTWQCTRSGVDLNKLLSSELSQLCQREVILTDA